MRAPLRTGELFAVLSLATDLGTAQPFEHGLATCMVAVRLGEAAGYGDDDLDAVHELALLHSLGCTSDASEAAARYGDDRTLRAAWTVVDGGDQHAVVRFLWGRTGERSGGPGHVLHFTRSLAQGPAAARRGFTAHCEVAHALSERVGAAEAVRDALWFVFERWDGRGHPRGRSGDELPRAARLLHVARDGIALARDSGAATAARLIGDRAGSAYEPELAELASRELPRWIAEAEAAPLWDTVCGTRPYAGRLLGEDDVDEACAAVADFADLKSVHTLGHSRGVAELAEAAAWRAGLDDDEVTSLRRAALLHDIGRVAVSTRIWDKPGPLGDSEREQVRLHPNWTERVLGRAAALKPLAGVAGAHHERLDGSGYHRARSARDLSTSARLLAAADVFHALSEPRPHRPAVLPREAVRVLEAEAPAGRLDPDAVRAVIEAAGERPSAPARGSAPGGLTDREVDVLRLVARGMTNRQVAAELGISPKTVGHHASHAYSKLGVTTRAAAALKAVELGIIRTD